MPLCVSFPRSGSVLAQKKRKAAFPNLSENEVFTWRVVNTATNQIIFWHRGTETCASRSTKPNG
jgi:hypothetical protein